MPPPWNNVKADWPASFEMIVVDRPAAKVVRITLNNPKKRNALSMEMRRDLFSALQLAEDDPAIHSIIVRGNGPSFCAGYDLAEDRSGKPAVYRTSELDGHWPRHVLDGWLKVMDMAKPVIGQVHGYCLAGGSELAAACDLLYVAQDAKIGYPVTRIMSPPDMQFHPWLMGSRRAMEMYLTGDSISGEEAVQAGFANRAFPADVLSEKVVEIAHRVALTPPDIQAFNKRAVHRAMDHMGYRTSLRAGTEIQAYAFHTPSSMDYRTRLEANRGKLTEFLTERDKNFGDYRVDHNKKDSKL